MNAIVAESRRGRWIPWVFVGGFLVVISANAVLVTAALRSYSGAITTSAYDRGREYGEILAEAERQRALGWRAAVMLQGDAVVVTVRTAEGTPLPADATVTGRLQRPLDQSSLPLAFTPAAAGTWHATATPPAGAWDAVMTVTRSTDRLDLRVRLVAP
jgi:nitrogen fixation protein FixH